MSGSPIRPIPTVRNFVRFFRTWGSKGNFRSIWDTVLPVAVVDRFYGDEEGSYQGLTAFVDTQGTTTDFPNQFPAIIIGSIEPDIDLLIHRMAVWIGFSIRGSGPTTPAGGIQSNVFIYTPTGGYDPVLNLAPLAFFDSALITPPSFTRGATVALGGYNPVLPADFGFAISNGQKKTLYTRGFFYPPSNEPGGSPSDRNTRNEWITFNPPLRLTDGITLAVQWDHRGLAAGNISAMWASFLFTERRLSG